MAAPAPDYPTRVRLTYAQCFPDDDDLGEVLVTGEDAVAAATPASCEAIVVDTAPSAAFGERLNARLARLAFEWSVVDGHDPTQAHGVSGADLAGTEALVNVLVPAARGVLGMHEALAACTTQPSELVTVLASGGSAGYERSEGVEAAAAAVAFRSQVGSDAPVRQTRSLDARNGHLIAKYARTRDPVFSLDALRASWGVRAAIALTNSLARARGTGATVVVYQYNPTAAFARRYATWPDRDLRLTRMRFGGGDVRGMLRAGDRGIGLQARRESVSVPDLACFFRRHALTMSERFVIAGVDVSGVVLPELCELAERHTRFAHAQVPHLRRALKRARAQAVLVPFDTVTDARLLVRVAHQEGIPVLMINDGFKGDDHTRDGELADFGCALSSSIAEHYFPARLAGRPVRVTGDPRSDERAVRPSLSPVWPARRILIGSLTFSPSDLNCRRSDPERMLSEILEGIATSMTASEAQITLKLHPADAPDVYEQIIDRHSDLDLRVVQRGDVSDLFAGSDIYITTYSTSLLEAAAAGLPFVYFRVNEQQLHPPFSGDRVMSAHTVTSASGFARMLDSDAPPAMPAGDEAAAWLRRFTGPGDGDNTARLLGALREALADWPHAHDTADPPHPRCAA